MPAEIEPTGIFAEKMCRPYDMGDLATVLNASLSATLQFHAKVRDRGIGKQRVRRIREAGEKL
jgi:hypothetical protein